MKNKTAEEVYVEMLKPAETVTFRVQHRLEDFSALKDVPGDGFYIRYRPLPPPPPAAAIYSSTTGAALGPAGNFLIQPIRAQILGVTGPMLITPHI